MNGQYQVRMNFHRNVVCVFSVGTKLTHYLGLNGCQLDCCEMPTAEFEHEYRVSPPIGTEPSDFANAWAKSDDSIRMIPISGSAATVLAAILRGRTVEHPTDGFAVNNLTRLEHFMAKKQAAEAVAEEGAFRKPDGPVAQIHAYLDKNLDRIKKGDVTRGELIKELTETKKQFALGTVQTQLGRWAQTNGIQFKAITLSPAAQKRQEKLKKAAEEVAA